MAVMGTETVASAPRMLAPLRRNGRHAREHDRAARDDDPSAFVAFFRASSARRFQGA